MRHAVLLAYILNFLYLAFCIIKSLDIFLYHLQKRIIFLLLYSFMHEYQTGLFTFFEHHLHYHADSQCVPDIYARPQ